MSSDDRQAHTQGVRSQFKKPPHFHQYQWLEVEAQRSVSCTCRVHQVQDQTPIHKQFLIFKLPHCDLWEDRGPYLIHLHSQSSTQAHTNSCQLNEPRTLENVSFSRLLHIHWHSKVASTIPMGRCEENALDLSQKMPVQASSLPKIHSTVLGKSPSLWRWGSYLMTSRFPFSS